MSIITKKLVLAKKKCRCDICNNSIVPKHKYVLDKNMKCCFTCADGYAVYTHDGFGNKIKVRIQNGKVVV